MDAVSRLDCGRRSEAAGDLTKMAKLAHRAAVLAQLWKFATEHRVYWLVPFGVMLLMAGALIVASEGATPFLYALF
ncbi:MAG: hypothetical protein RIT45_1138 [Pseudomonadota bacterium]